MPPCSPAKLVIFDYSGTLSLDAPRFARQANLLSALAESGLARLGVVTPELFWDEIVDPTWAEGSTTAIGYKQVIAKRIRELGLAFGAAGAEIAAASSRFVDRYLDHSRIDPRWRPVLEKLTRDPLTSVIIATDHYAEATEAIIHNLDSWNIPARMVGATEGRSSEGAVLSLHVANSADIGFWKADRRFWETLKSLLPLETIRSVLMIDDFGFNEERRDRYGVQARIEARQKETAASIQAIFQTSPVVLPFLLAKGERNHDEDSARRIAEAVHKIERFITDVDGINKG